uniref:Uncharacterized protein n=1 Tax=Rhizophora mucronata TaxID=61149 RepID=A0A2P2ISE5_RHIMU
MQFRFVHRVSFISKQLIAFMCIAGMSIIAPDPRLGVICCYRHSTSPIGRTHHLGIVGSEQVSPTLGFIPFLQHTYFRFFCVPGNMAVDWTRASAL